MGLERNLLVHRVLPGESIAMLANEYVTTEDAIRAVNYGMGETLWAHTLVVIPFERSNVSGIPPMTAYLIDVSSISIETLAVEKSVDVELLRTWNALPKGYLFHLGEVFIIPYISP
jgi:hypothetical protein